MSNNIKCKKVGEWHEVLEQISFSITEYSRIGFVQKRKNGWVAAIKGYMPITGQDGLSCLPLYFPTRAKAMEKLIEENSSNEQSRD